MATLINPVNHTVHEIKRTLVMLYKMYGFKMVLRCPEKLAFGVVVRV